MKTRYYTATSLDGYIADPDHSLGWLFQFPDPDESSYSDFIRDVGAVAMGSHTYEWLLDNYVYEDPEQPRPWPHEQPVWVFTTRALAGVPDADIRFVRGDVAPVFAEMREAAPGKDIWVAGGGDLAAQFHAEGLLDEIVVTIAPVILAGGAPLFTRRIVEPPLKVVGVTPHGNGLTELRLEVQSRSGGAEPATPADSEVGDGGPTAVP